MLHIYTYAHKHKMDKYYPHVLWDIYIIHNFLFPQITSSECPCTQIFVHALYNIL